MDISEFCSQDRHRSRPYTKNVCMEYLPFILYVHDNISFGSAVDFSATAAGD